ncbi:unnamed protein product [Adineta ricciae]|uniref:Uncharacterized protein n=1 Tax=Adineta ricciae TaxID=249248 RepID=A0A815TBB1_ADIRI|nr:unnamed protein product [Adineta ricciae]
MERISTLIPKFKQQLIFLEEREKLLRKINDRTNSHDSESSDASTNGQLLGITTSTNYHTLPTVSADRHSHSSSFMHANTARSEHSSDKSIGDSAADRSNSDPAGNTSFPEDYKMPVLPDALIKDVNDGNIVKFGPHCSNRRILIDAVVYDLINKYNLFYPTHKQFGSIGNGIVKFLKLPLTVENIAVWKDALQTKLKRQRSEHPDNVSVQEYRMRYSKSGSGRPVKRQVGTTAQRDRYKQMMMMVMSPDDPSSDEIWSKADQLRKNPPVDIHVQLSLWKETLHLRRQSIRDRSTADILKDFPGYGNPLLVFEEVQMLMKISLADAVRIQIPILLEKLVEAPVFITDSSAVRLMKVLCQRFDETLQHVFCDTEPPTPYPTLVCINDRITIFVDFVPILSTNSPDDALALLISMYTIFELSFDKKSRAIRLLYSVLHGDKRFLSNSIRNLIREKEIDIYWNENKKSPLFSSNNQSADSTTLVIEPQTQTQTQPSSDLLNESKVEQNSPVASQTSQTKSSNDVPDFNLDMPGNVNEYCENMENILASSICIPQSKKLRGRKRKNSNVNEQNENVMNNSRKQDDQCSNSNSLPLKDITNSTVTLRQSKRKRRN